MIMIEVHERNTQCEGKLLARKEIWLPIAMSLVDAC